jgi:hypothetical protein
MLTGLKLGLSGCSPPRFFFYSRLEPGSLHILLRMRVVVSSFLMSFTTHSRFRNYTCLISLVTVDVLSCCLQCCYGFRVLKHIKKILTFFCYHISFHD